MDEGEYVCVREGGRKGGRASPRLASLVFVLRVMFCCVVLAWKEAGREGGQQLTDDDRPAHPSRMND